MKKYQLAVIPGDGIGKEVTPAAIKVLDTIAELSGKISFEYTEFPWSCDYYAEHGKMMPDDGLDQLKKFDAIFLGAIGNPSIVADHIALWGLLIKIRREFQQTINLRPAKYFEGLKTPLTDPKGFDLVVVRENSEGEYSEVGGRIHQGTREMSIQNSIFTRTGVEGAMRFAFELAKTRRNHVTSATKSNGIVHTMPFWDEVFNDVKTDYSEVETVANHIDALSAFFVTRPEAFDVVVSSNLFGDILSDISAAVMGSIGIAPAANINLTGDFPSMFEPVHGSAPEIAGQNIANPIGQIWTAKMMLDHFGEHELGDQVLTAIEEVTKNGIKTPDIGGTSSTTEVADAICKQIKEAAAVK